MLNEPTTHFLRQYPDIAQAYEDFSEIFVAGGLPLGYNENLLCLCFIGGYRYGDEAGCHAVLDPEMEKLRDALTYP